MENRGSKSMVRANLLGRIVLLSGPAHLHLHWAWSWWVSDCTRSAISYALPTSSLPPRHCRSQASASSSPALHPHCHQRPPRWYGMSRTPRIPFDVLKPLVRLLFFRVLVIAVWFLPWYGRRSPSWSTLLPVPPDVLCPALCSRFRRLDWGSYLRSNSRAVLGCSPVLN
jgi:hypothetical protein